jgi:hypothetical protein
MPDDKTTTIETIESECATVADVESTFGTVGAVEGEDDAE